MSLFSNDEATFLQEHQLGRLATAGRNGAPHVVPTGYQFDPDRGVLKIGAHSLEIRGQRRLYVRHIEAGPRVAFVVDDVVTEPVWRPRGLTVKGNARLRTEGGEVLGPGFGPNWIEIVPDWVSAWGIDTDSFQAAVPRKV
ncbi:pyridoxamine 5'-phosphate oxidase family protein [Amycolatopsis sp. NPDC051371]|uniref:pyridoxamine 5'-phosphate oxidase family protein n=1 Tax=Amycolatopsis sp. NPDC051371 TaxID=3155800 RepID=UPI00343962B9